MGLRFRKSFRIVPGVRLNVGLRRTSISFGGRGFTYNVGSNGSRVTAGIPGSGLSFSTSVQHQNPVSLVASSLPARRRYSATPYIIAAFLFGLVALAVHSTEQGNTTPKAVASGPVPDQSDITGSTAKSIQETGSSIEDPIPLPRPRPRVRTDSVSPPLQILPQE